MSKTSTNPVSFLTLGYLIEIQDESAGFTDVSALNRLKVRQEPRSRQSRTRTAYSDEMMSGVRSLSSGSTCGVDWHNSSNRYPHTTKGYLIMKKVFVLIAVGFALVAGSYAVSTMSSAKSTSALACPRTPC